MLPSAFNVRVLSPTVMSWVCWGDVAVGSAIVWPFTTIDGCEVPTAGRSEIGVPEMVMPGPFGESVCVPIIILPRASGVIVWPAMTKGGEEGTPRVGLGMATMLPPTIMEAALFAGGRAIGVPEIVMVLPGWRIWPAIMTAPGEGPGRIGKVWPPAVMAGVEAAAGVCACTEGRAIAVPSTMMEERLLPFPAAGRAMGVPDMMIELPGCNVCPAITTAPGDGPDKRVNFCPPAVITAGATATGGCV
jgi:hypothetical protein